ncbi:MAG: FAD-dependent oxidoreductase [Candidatus Hermodarchaeota archaeon]
MQQYDQFIAGGGLGGLLASALLSQKRHTNFLVERLPFFGGRFTSFKYRGFEAPTGAIHMIPHSYRGPLGQLILKELNLPIQIHDIENFTAWYWPNRKPIYHRSFWGIFKAFPYNRQRFSVLRKLLLGARKSEQHLESFHDYLESWTDDPQIFKFFNAITGFALSLDISELSTASMYRFLRRLYQRGRPGVPIGGCKAIIKALVTQSRQNGAVLKKKIELTELEMDGTLIVKAICRNVETLEEFEIHAKQFILNLGHPQANRIMKRSKISFRLPSVPIARGGGFIYRTLTPVFDSSAVSQFPEHDYVKGAVEPSSISPDLSPKGEHLFLTHQVFHSDNITQDIRRARDELLETLPQLNENEELCVHTFNNEWPVNYAAQGNDISNFCEEIPNLFFVGDSYKGNDGWFMTEGIAHGVKLVVDSLVSNSE